MEGIIPTGKVTFEPPPRTAAGAVIPDVEWPVRLQGQIVAGEPFQVRYALDRYLQNRQSQLGEKLAANLVTMVADFGDAGRHATLWVASNNTGFRDCFVTPPVDATSVKLGTENLALSLGGSGQVVEQDAPLQDNHFGDFWTYPVQPAQP